MRIMELSALLGLDGADSLTRRSRTQVKNDRQLLADLVARRAHLGLSQGEVANRMDISQSAVARIEAGSRDVHQSTLRRYAMAVEVVIEHTVIPDDEGRGRAAKAIAQFTPGSACEDIARWTVGNTSNELVRHAGAMKAGDGRR